MLLIKILLKNKVCRILKRLLFHEVNKVMSEFVFLINFVSQVQITFITNGHTFVRFASL